MKTIKITPAFAVLLQTNSWVIINQDYAVGAYKSRQAARDAKTAENLEGSIKNKSEVEFEVIELVKPVEKIPKTFTDQFGTVATEPVAPAKKTSTPITHESIIENPCKTVWGIATDMKAANPLIKRSAVLAACVAAGIAYYTARTQYQAWLQVQKEMAEREALQTKK